MSETADANVPATEGTNNNTDTKADTALQTTTTTPSTSLGMGSYGSSYGLGMGGYGGMGMGMGMGGYGMGMGMGGMGMMGRRGMNGQGPISHSLHQDTRAMFHGMRSMIHMGFATFGVFTYGKLFMEMIKNAMGWSYRTTIWLFKKFLSTFILNSWTTKVLNGIFNSFGRGGGGPSVGPGQVGGPQGSSLAGIFFRGLMTAGLMALGLIWFMYKQSNMSEYEHLLEERLRKRKIERELKMKEFNEQYEKAMEQAQREMEAYNQQNEAKFEQAFKEAEELKKEDELENEAKSKTSELNIDIEEEHTEETSGTEEEEIESLFNTSATLAQKESTPKEPSQEPEGKKKELVNVKHSEEFWDYNKEVEVMKKCHEEGEALNNLFENKFEERKALLEKKAQEKAKEESDILSLWPTVPTIEPTPEPIHIATVTKANQQEESNEGDTDVTNKAKIEVSASEPLSEQPQQEKSNEFATNDMLSFMNANTSAKPKKPWLR